MVELSFKNRSGLFFSNLASHLGLNGRVAISIHKVNGVIHVRIPEMDIAIPAARRWPRYKRGWDKRTQRLLYQFGVGEVATIGPGDTVIDIGANIGEFSLGATKLGANVIAIEGDPLTYKCLEYNIRQESLIKAYQNVIWKENTRLTFYSEPSDADSSVFKPNSGVPTTALEVNAITLDTIAEKEGLGDIAFLKCDAEGAEPEVIIGGMTILSRTRVVAFDTGAERMGEETSFDCEILLKDLGFSVFHDRRPNRKITFGVRQ